MSRAARRRRSLHRPAVARARVGSTLPAAAPSVRKFTIAAWWLTRRLTLTVGQAAYWSSHASWHRSSKSWSPYLVPLGAQWAGGGPWCWWSAVRMPREPGPRKTRQCPGRGDEGKRPRPRSGRAGLHRPHTSRPGLWASVLAHALRGERPVVRNGLVPATSSSGSSPIARWTTVTVPGPRAPSYAPRRPGRRPASTWSPPGLAGRRLEVTGGLFALRAPGARVPRCWYGRQPAVPMCLGLTTRNPAAPSLP